MRSSEVTERVRTKLAELGVPAHIFSVRKVPSRVRVCLLLRKTAWTLDLRKGITAIELEHKLDHLAAVWNHANPKEQIDIEDLTR